MSYISADDYESGVSLISPFGDNGANCNDKNLCPTQYGCVNSVCQPTTPNPPPINFITVPKPMMFNGNVFNVPKGIPLQQSVGIFSLKMTGNEFQACNVDADCEPGTWCLNKPQGTGSVCLNSGNGNVGASCADGRDCLVGLDCYLDPSVNKNVCLPSNPVIPPQQVLQENLPKGSDCYFGYQCQSPLNCGPNMKCE